MAPLPLHPLLIVCVLLPAALAVDTKAESIPDINGLRDNQEPLLSRFARNAGSEHSGHSSENTPNARHHTTTTCQSTEPNPSQSSLTCTAQCPLCPTCPPAQLCPSPCPAVPKCPDPQACPSPCQACPACPACKRPVPPGYEYFQGLGHYCLHNVPVNWYEAKETCEREGAHLAIINSQEEANLMKKLFSRDGDIGILIYLGFHDLYKEGRYVTLFGQPLATTGYNTWPPGQPDNAGGNENCGSMFPSGGLNDMNCASKQPFVCEFPA